jgi:hypothetical protein
MIVPGHSPHEKRARVAKNVCLSINPPVMHETGIANRSPGDQNGDAGQFIVYHLAGA